MCLLVGIYLSVYGGTYSTFPVGFVIVDYKEMFIEIGFPDDCKSCNYKR